jgi:sugar (pentulose or hexulose) kinase
MLVLNIGATAATNLIVGLYANDTSAATQGTIATGKDVIFAVHDNTAAYLGTGTLADNTYPAVGQFVQSTGLLTATTAPANKAFLFSYVGDKRYIRLLVDNASNTTAVYSVVAIQGRARYRGRGGIYVEPYRHNA